MYAIFDSKYIYRGYIHITIIFTTLDTTVILKFIQYFILSTCIAAISSSYDPIQAEASRAPLPASDA